MPQPVRISLMRSTAGTASKHSNTQKTVVEDGVNKLPEAAKRRKEKDSFQFHFRMLMLPFKRMRVYDNHPIYHMRVSKKGNTSQIGNKYQWKEKLLEYESNASSS